MHEQGRWVYGRIRPSNTAKTPNGNVYTDAKGMTLCTFDNDKAGMSTCYDERPCGPQG